MLRILLSNDDGVMAIGIQILAKELRKFYFVQIIAPDRDRSGSSHSLTLHKPLRVNKLLNNDISVEGTPVDCVYLGVNKFIYPSPDIVISGINGGCNLGDDVIYSGTVAAAIEGRHLKYPALSISLNGKINYDTAVKVTCHLLKILQKNPITSGIILNINIPDVPISKIKGYKITRCGKRFAASNVYTVKDPRENITYWLGPIGKAADSGPNTDFEAISLGYVSITPLHIDLTNYKAQKIVQEWIINL